MAVRLGGVIRVRREVLEGRISDAVDLSVVARRVLYGASDGSWMSDPRGFIDRTFVTEGMRRAVKTVLASLSGKTRIGDESATRVVVLPSLLGGGKTHLLGFLLYMIDVFRREGLDGVRGVDRQLERAFEVFAGAVSPGSVRVAVVVGDSEEFAPRPGRAREYPWGWRAQTLWGYILGLLGVPWEEWKHYDEKVEVPGVDTLRRLIGDAPALILIDEITSYAGSLRMEYRDMVVTFLKNLFQAVDSLPRAVVVVTLPAEVDAEARSISRTEHPVRLSTGQELVRMVYSMAQRVDFRAIPPVNMESDLASIMKKRLLEGGGWLAEAARRAREEYEYYMDEELEKALRLLKWSRESFLDDLEKTYPFHPLYIKLLLDIGSHVPGFKRTRSLIRITARLLASPDRLNASLVMPWHLDVENPDIRAELLAEHPRRDYYRKVLLEDLRTVNSEFEGGKRDVAKKVITVVWLYSVALGSFLNVQRMIESAPPSGSLPAYIVEPVLAERGIRASDVIDLVDEMKRSHLNIVEVEGTIPKLLYPLLPDINDIIRKSYEVTGLDSVFRRLLELAGSVDKQGTHFRLVRVIVQGLESTLNELRQELASTEDPSLIILLDPQTDPETVAGLLPHNNSFMLAADYDVRLEEKPRIKRVADRLRRRFPFIENPVTVWDTLVVIARLLDTVEKARKEAGLLGIEKPVLEIMDKKLNDMLKALSTDLYTVIEYSLTRLYGGVEGLKKRNVSVDLSSILYAYAGDKERELFQVVSALEAYLKNNLGIEDTLSYEKLLRVARILSRTGRANIYGDELEIIERPTSIAELWDYMLRSRDERVEAHLMSRKSFAESIYRIYQGMEESNVAFLLDTPGNRRLVVWLRAHEAGSPQVSSCYIGMLPHNRFYDERMIIGIVSKELRTQVRDLTEALMRMRIVHPVIVVEDFVRSLLDDEKPRRSGGVDEVRRYYLVNCAKGGAEREELASVFAMLRGNPARLYEKLMRSMIVYERRVLEKSYTVEVEPVENELEFEAGQKKTLTLSIRVYSSDYPAPIEVIGRIIEPETGRTVREEIVIVNQARKRSFREAPSLAIQVPEEPGEYMLELYTKGLYESDRVEISHVKARLRVRGEKCFTVESSPAELGEKVGDAYRWEVHGVRIELESNAPRAAFTSWLLTFLSRLRPLGPTLTVEASLRTGGGRIDIRGENLSVEKAGTLLNTIARLYGSQDTSIEKLLVNARLQTPVVGDVSSIVVPGLESNTILLVWKCFRIA